MKSPSLDSFYISINKFISLAESYSEINGLSKIIKTCRLKPYDYIFKYKSNKIILYKKWFDEFGNSLSINKSNDININIGDLSLDRSKITCTDLYYGFDINQAIKISKLMMINVNVDEDTQEEIFIVSLYGIDNYLRCYLYSNCEWKKVSPLILGIENLKTLIKNIDIAYFFELNIKDNCALPGVAKKSWLSSLPLTNSFIETINKQCNTTLPIRI